MPFGEIYGAQDNPRTLPSLVAAKELGLELTLRAPNVSSEEYLKLNPQGLIPTFVGADGFVLTESTAILTYIASQKDNNPLLGKTKQDTASVHRWLSYSNTQILPNLAGWFAPILGRRPYDEAAVNEAKAKSLKNVDIIAKHLEGRQYLVGDSLTIADLYVAGQLTRGFSFVLDKEWREANPGITAWAERIYALPAWREVIKEPVWSEKAITYPYTPGQ
ncbi:glutathione S-transferase [Aspergillus karnatakaensis]|uniref:glutathione S-transferase family protein n=1 Tax=Aspergillus karnatakaensis TaxID=1810916 RepID=UPI003CCCD50F